MPTKLTALLCLCTVACTNADGPHGLAIADSVAYACVPVLVPGPDDEGTIDNFVPGPDGLMAWTSGESELRIGTTAEQARTIGRKGEGPGEFAWVGELGWLGDTLWATDFMLSRVQYFDRQGTFLGGRRLPVGGGWRHTRDGRLLAIGSKPIGASGWSVLAMAGDSTVPRADTMHHFSGPEVPVIQVPMGGGASMITQDPFAETAHAIAAPDMSRFCGSEPLGGDQVNIRCIDDRGIVVLDTTLTLAPESLTDDIWNSTIDRYARRAPGGRASVERMFIRPASLPRVTALGVDRDGALWIARRHMSDSVQRWMRLTATGMLRDTLLFQGGYIAHLSGDTLWRHRSDVDGMQSVERCVAK